MLLLTNRVILGHSKTRRIDISFSFYFKSVATLTYEVGMKANHFSQNIIKGKNGGSTLLEIMVSLG